jgi:hypothetical protein
MRDSCAKNAVRFSDTVHVDGTRKRRFSPLKARREWYSRHRARRFARHLGFL